MRVAVPRAWVRARRTILSADTVSFLAAAILYYFAAGDVKGFAFTLGLSTILDLVVVFLFTHPLVSLLSRVRGVRLGALHRPGRVARRRRPSADAAGAAEPGAAPARRAPRAEAADAGSERRRVARPRRRARRDVARPAGRRRVGGRRRRTVDGADRSARSAGARRPTARLAPRRASSRTRARRRRGPRTTARREGRAADVPVRISRLYRGETRIEFIGNRERWYFASLDPDPDLHRQLRLPRLQLRRRVRRRHPVPDPGHRHLDHHRRGQRRVHRRRARRPRTRRRRSAPASTRQIVVKTESLTPDEQQTPDGQGRARR